jgi:hypothetical protein
MSKMTRGRKAAVWIVLIGFLLGSGYALLGFILAPYLIRSQLLPKLSRQMGAPLSVETVEINPFQLTVKFSGFSLKTPSDGKLLDFRELYAELDVTASLKQKQAVISGRLTGPEVKIERDATGRFNFSPLLQERPKDQLSDAAIAIPLLITRFELAQGRVEFKDLSRSKHFATILEDASFSLEHFSLASDHPATFHFTATSHQRENIALQGQVSFSPFLVDGKIEANQVDLAPLIDYFVAPTAFRIDHGKAHIQGSYRFRGGAQADFEIISADGEIRDLQVTGQNGASLLQIASLGVRRLNFSQHRQHLKLGAIVVKKATMHSQEEQSTESLQGSRIDSLEILDFDCALNERAISIGSLVSEKAEINTRRTTEGVFSILGIPSKTTQEEPSKSAPPSPPWTGRIEEARLHQYSVRYWDETAKPPVKLHFTPISLQLSNVALDSTIAFGLETGLGQKGIIRADGQIDLDPLTVDGRLEIEKVRLHPFQPYLDPWVGIEVVKGRLNLSGDVSLARKADLQISFGGNAEITHLGTIDQKEKKDFVSWNSLRLDGVILDTSPKRLSIRSVTLQEPYARVLIGEKGDLNIVEKLSRKEPAKAIPSIPKSAEPWPIVIGSFRVAEGKMYFSDLTLQPNFAAEIHSLNGNIRGLSSQANAKADVLLEGKINHSSPVSISGQINPFKFSTYSDIAMRFRDVNLTTLSPYSGKFAGYRIEKGKLNMDLRYRLADRKLRADNKMVLDQLVLGERVDSPNATSLPVRLAIALLRNSQGRIDIDLPISGNLDNPQFSLKGLLSDAITQMMTKLIRSPFAVLGSLIPNGGEELGYIKFRAGDFALDEQEKTKLEKIASALKQRPGLNLDIKGSADLRQDRTALAELELLKQIKNARLTELRSSGTWTREVEEVSLSDEDYRRLFMDFFRTHHPLSQQALELKRKNQQTLEENLFDQAKEEVLKQWDVSELDLRLLAQNRSETIRRFLTEQGGLPNQRIFLLDVNILEEGFGEEASKSFLSLSGS